MDRLPLLEWNPWWEKKDSILDFQGKPRQRYFDLIHSLDVREVTIITGVRRSGKSTLMYQMIALLLERGVLPEQLFFVNFEDKRLQSFSLDQIYTWYRENMNPEKKAFVFLDEIHTHSGWESWIRTQYDLKSPCKFVISGSSSYLLRKEYSTLLTGRNLTFEVFPLSFSEYLDFKNISYDKVKLRKGLIGERTKHQILYCLKEFITLGGFPEIFFQKEEYKTKLLAQYFDDIVYKDIVDRYNLTSQKVKDLALYLATNLTGLVSLRNLRNSLGLSYDTSKDYLGYFQEAFLFFVVDHFSYSLQEQKTLPSKVYCIDNGLRNAVSLHFSKDEGKLVENMVFLELKRRGKVVYYWKNKGEVDFMVKGTPLLALNVSYADAVNERELRALQECKEKWGKNQKLVLLTRDLEKKEKGIHYIPLWKWLLQEDNL